MYKASIKSPGPPTALGKKAFFFFLDFVRFIGKGIESIPIQGSENGLEGKRWISVGFLAMLDEEGFFFLKEVTPLASEERKKKQTRIFMVEQALPFLRSSG